jgi:hypothetical protein
MAGVCCQQGHHARGAPLRRGLSCVTVRPRSAVYLAVKHGSTGTHRTPGHPPGSQFALAGGWLCFAGRCALRRLSEPPPTDHLHPTCRHVTHQLSGGDRLHSEQPAGVGWCPLLGCQQLSEVLPLGEGQLPADRFPGCRPLDCRPVEPPLTSRGPRGTTGNLSRLAPGSHVAGTA